MTSSAQRFAKNLREERLGLDWSQLKLAQAIGVDVTTVSRIERNKAGVTVERAAELAAALGANLARMLSDADSPKIAEGMTDPSAISSARSVAKFKARREELGLSQTAVAARGGLGRDYISRLEKETSDTKLYLTTLEKLARGLGVQIADLL